MNNYDMLRKIAVDIMRAKSEVEIEEAVKSLIRLFIG